MASSAVQSNKNIKRLHSKKSHSWWWDSHVSPKNSRWLAENLEEMDSSVRRMLKLIEEDGDSLAKKAQMYYLKRPELISLVEEFYRMYRSLAERYDHVTGELKRNIPSDLLSQGSDNVSETSSLASPVPEQRGSRRRSGRRAAGFDYFLGSRGSSSDLHKEDESSTLTDSETESDNSSLHNFALFGNGGDHAHNTRINELETEVRDMKERIQVQQEENGDYALRHARHEHSEDLLARISEYEQDLKTSNQRIRDSEEEVARLKVELQKYKSIGENDNNMEEKPESETETETETGESDRKIQAIAEELRMTKEKLQNSEKEIVSLKHQLESDERISSLQEQLASAHKDVNTWKTKLNAEKKEVTKLQERISRLKSSLADRDHEARDLKIAISDAEEKIFPEKAQIKAEISKLLEERSILQEQVRELESRNRSLEDEMRVLQVEKSEKEERHSSEINKLKEEIAERNGLIVSLNKSIDGLKLERDETNVQVISMEKHLEQLHMEHVELIARAEEARKLAGKLRAKANELEEEVERQRGMIEEAAEEKREAIRQLCFSLEHYRNGYQRLRAAFIGHKRVPVLAV
ncbi:protein NETWORKED 4B-like [Euphorbia lathyris]|uniref:protein NETWORKED 4B-like n=1 Tax=Euphorbia lathyris TaxID=212925 RepID=UPI003313D580